MKKKCKRTWRGGGREKNRDGKTHKRKRKYPLAKRRRRRYFSCVRARVILCEPVNNRAKCAVSHRRQTLLATTTATTKDLCFRLTAVAARVRFFSKRRVSFSLHPPPHPLLCVVFVSPPNYTIEIKKPKNRWCEYVIISHTMARGIRKIRQYGCRRLRDLSKRSHHVLYYNNAYYNAHNVIIHLYDIKYIQTCRSAIGFVMTILEAAAADENLHFRR